MRRDGGRQPSRPWVDGLFGSLTPPAFDRRWSQGGQLERLVREVLPAGALATAPAA